MCVYIFGYIYFRFYRWIWFNILNCYDISLRGFSNISLRRNYSSNWRSHRFYWRYDSSFWRIDSLFWRNNSSFRRENNWLSLRFDLRLIRWCILSSSPSRRYYNSFRDMHNSARWISSDISRCLRMVISACPNDTSIVGDISFVFIIRYYDTPLIIILRSRLYINFCWW